MQDCGLGAVVRDREAERKAKLGEPVLVIRYRAGIARLGLLTMAALTPFWLGWIPYFVWIAGHAVWVAGLHGYEDLLHFALALAGLFLLCLLNVRVCLDDALTVSRKGIRLPAIFWINPLMALGHGWGSVRSLEFRRLGRKSTYPEELRISFGKFGKVSLRLDGFSRDDLARLLLAVEAYSPGLPVVPPLGEVDLGLPVHGIENQGRSFTELWESDLRRRFGAGTYVPLEEGAELQYGRLQVAGQIAFGGLSAVYLARLRDRSVVVLKEFVLPTNTDDSARTKALEMFQREARILGGLSHPRIARVLDHFVENDRHYLVLQHVPGKDLRRFVQDEGPQPPRTVGRWAAELCRILEYLHGLDPPIVHRDLTPDNLVLEPDGSLTLIDFGAANAFLGTATGTLVGKQSYISPEQFRGKAVPGSDIYSLGCTLFYLLTGQDPVPLSVSRPREAVPTLPGVLDNLVVDCTALEVADRIGSAQEVTRRLSSAEVSLSAG